MGGGGCLVHPRLLFIFLFLKGNLLQNIINICRNKNTLISFSLKTDIRKGICYTGASLLSRKYFVSFILCNVKLDSCNVEVGDSDDDNNDNNSNRNIFSLFPVHLERRIFEGINGG